MTNALIQSIGCMFLIVASIAFGMFYGAYNERNAVQAEAVALGLGEYYLVHDKHFGNVERKFRWKTK